MGRRKKMPKEQRQAYVEKKAAKREFLLKKKLLCRAEKAAKRQLRAEQKKAARAAFQAALAPEGDVVQEEPMPVVEVPADEASAPDDIVAQAGAEAEATAEEEPFDD